MALLKHGHEVEQGVSCNDRKFEVWELSALTGEKTEEGFRLSKARKVQVYAVPRDGFRGALTEKFKVVIDGVVVESTDLGELRRKAQKVFSAIAEGEYEKVLVVRTSGRPSGGGRDEKGDQFGIEWQVGWRVAKLDAVFSESRGYLLDVENYDEPEPEPDASGFRICKAGERGRQEHKVAVLPWTQWREDVLRRTVQELGLMRERANRALLDVDSFSRLLDSPGRLHLLGDGK